MKILVSGGLGFIGSHTVVELLNANYEVVIVDDLSNSYLSVLNNIFEITNKKPTFYNVDIKNFEQLKPIFDKEKISSIIHFAGYKAVGESVLKPLMYYENNLITTINLLKLMNEYNVDKFIFSSSATVYGEQPSPLTEISPLMETSNPYGETKKISEKIIADFAINNQNKTFVNLRYFNPIGAHESGLIGELPQGVPNNLMPYITQVANKKREKLFVFGNDYPTVDGTGVRDYIHVVDLAKGHLMALEKANVGLSVYNLGTGKGISVLELVAAFERVNNIKIPYEITNRRPGDLDIVYADPKKAFVELGFETTKTTDDMVRDAWRFEKNLMNK